MYPKNNASPPIIAVGQVILIADGSVVTADAAARVKIGTGGWGASAGTLACDTTSGCWTYIPSQAETNAESFIVAVYKASCIGCQATVVTTASATAGKASVSDFTAGAIANASFAADVGSTAYATNIIALAVRKVLDELNLDHLLKVACAENDINQEVVDQSVLAFCLATGGDISQFAPTTDTLQNIREKLPTNLEDLNITDTTGLVRPDMANASGNYGGTVATVTTTTTATNLTNLPAITTGWLTAAGVAAGALEADAFATGVLSTAAQVAAAVNINLSAAWATQLGYIDAAITSRHESGVAIPATIAVGAIANNAITNAAVADDVDVNTKTITAGAIANASFNADVQSTAYASNIIALAVRKVLDELLLDRLVKVACTENDITATVVENTILAQMLTISAITNFVRATDSLQGDHDTTATAIGAVPTALENADALLARDVDNVEAAINASGNEDCLASIVLQLRHSNTVDNAGYLTVYQTNGTTEFCQIAVTSESSTDTVTGVEA